MNLCKIAGLSLLSIALAGCATGGAAGSGGASGEAARISVRDFADRTVVFSEVPKNIVALSNGDMDIVYALGGTLVGRPTSSGPLPVPEAADVEQVGSTHEVDLEKITLARPDVVLGSASMNAKDVPALEGIGTKVVLTEANSVDDIKKQIGLLGQLLRKEEKAKELIAGIDAKLAEVRSAAGESGPRVLLVYGAPGTNMAALPNSLGGSILELAGGTNIAADYPALQNFPQYAQLNVERIMLADPQYILIMTHGDPEAVRDGFVSEMEKNAAWNGIDAVRNGRVDVLPSDLFGTNPGTRVTEAIDLLRGLFEAGGGPAE
ncbi:ABC transporter substrate-binding protein [Cohnella algarum]|uniref:ABC transporter substrate-binding protein n=1 Tax=Cohnella algarum TaxID=2044859 RepID=UPI001967F6C0|nr:ABC transporter substrate-binding protein [Cohnella algarum]MBN2980907.1 ABC transporter substrate-binding protein [Cohnella algarum]